jgi:hypothetical protein
MLTSSAHGNSGRAMPKLTSRDYKSKRRGPLELRRYRQFLYGTGAGILLASVAFLYVGARQHKSAPAPELPPSQHAVAAADSSAPGAGNSETFTYPDMLAKTVVPIREREQHMKREPPARHHAQDAAR